MLRFFAEERRKNVHWKSWVDPARHCLRCGHSLFWRYVQIERRKRFVCAQCQFIAYQNPKIVGATLPVKKGKIYLLRRAIEPSYGRWSYPGGYMEMGETVEEAARRETWEEIRAKVRIIGPSKIYSYRDAATVAVVYPAEITSSRPRPGPESLEVRAFQAHQIPWKKLAFRSNFYALRDGLRSGLLKKRPD